MGFLRLYLALSVLLHHRQFPGSVNVTHLDGGVAVLAFFVISGFYMTYVLQEKYVQYEDPKTTFYLSRLTRIFPLYLIVLAFAVIFFRSINQPSVFFNSLGLSTVAWLSLLCSNILIVGQDIFNIIVEDRNNGSPITSTLERYIALHGAENIQSNPVHVLIGQAWSLSIELLFYLIAPFVVLKTHRVFWLLGCSIAIRITLPLLGFPSIPYGIRFFPSVLVFFLMGSISYYLYKKIEGNLLAEKLGRLLFSVLLLGVVIIAPMQLPILQGANFDTLYHWIFYVTLMLSIPLLFSATKDSRFDSHIGEYSYPIYLIHGLILGYMVAPIENLEINGAALVVIWSLFFSWLLIHTIERPVDTLRAKIGKRKT